MTTISQQIESVDFEPSLPMSGKRTGFSFSLALATVGILFF